MVMGVGGYTWWKYNGQTLMQDAQAADGEGRRFGAGKDSTACTGGGWSGRTKGIGFSGAVAARLFLESCLKAAKLEAGFCDGVPGATELLKLVSWQAQLNQKYGLHPPFESVVLPQSNHRLLRVSTGTAAKVTAWPGLAVCTSEIGSFGS